MNLKNLRTEIKMTTNPLFDECELEQNKKYAKGDWRKISVHDEKNVKGFFGNYKFLSNFQNATVMSEGLPFSSSEHAYMFAKLESSQQTEELYDKVSKMTCKEVKFWGQTVKLRSDWEDVKLEIMSAIVFDKFYRNKDLRQKLLDTEDKYLEELCWWGDVYWGVDIKKGGQNNLGKILMKVREFWKND